MPDTEEIKKGPMVDIDTSGPEVDVFLPEEKDNEKENENETVVENDTKSDDATEKSNEQLDVQVEDNVKGKEDTQENKKK